MSRLMGDLSPAVDGDNIINSDDLNEYTKALDLNNSPSAYKTVEGETTYEDAINGGLTTDQASVADLHFTGYIGKIDRYILGKYLEAKESETDLTLEDFIKRIDTAEIIPDPDPSEETAETMREYITTNILNLCVFRAVIMLELQKLPAKSLNDLRERSERLWGEAYYMEYDKLAQLHANIKAAMDEEPKSEYGTDSGYVKLPLEVMEKIAAVIKVLTKTELETVRDKYWTASAVTFSDPPTDEERDKLRQRMWNTAVASAVEFYDAYSLVNTTTEGS